MPCHSAVLKKNLTVSENDTVEDVLAAIQKDGVPAAVVLDDKDHFVGLFSMKILLKNLIPVSVAMSDGVEIDIKLTAAPGVAKRLSNVKVLPVLELMDRKPVSVAPDSPIWEGVSALTRHGNPLCVVDDQGKFHGLITYESLLNDLEKMISEGS